MLNQLPATGFTIGFKIIGLRRGGEEQRFNALIRFPELRKEPWILSRGVPGT